MTTAIPHPLFAYVGAFVAELPRAGVQHAVVCPGSRSTPLAMALADQADMRVWMHVDERSAAFFALGMAKTLRAPVALVCTSGTAAANFFPAIVEAQFSHVPLLVLTADRPPELREVGAPQAIDQLRLYGTQVKWFHEVALPEATPAALRYIRVLADRAAALAQAIPAGPVHLNFPFREPLVPPPEPPREATNGQLNQHLLKKKGKKTDPAYSPAEPEVSNAEPAAPAVVVTAAQATILPPHRIYALADQCWNTPRGLIVVGPNAEPDLAEGVLTIAAELNYPVLVDPLSGLRGATNHDAVLCASYDAFLRDDAFSAANPPQMILRFGAMPVSKPLLLYLQRYATCPQVVIDGNGGWDDPALLATEMIHADPTRFCHDLHEDLKYRFDRDYAHLNPWLEQWRTAEQVTQATLRTAITAFPEPFEGRVFTELADLLPANATLFVGNSMPVRDLDTFFWHAPGVRVLCNRGANGIDGVVSSALGACAAQPEAPTVLVVGDLSFYHDLNGLLAAKLHQLNLTIVLINNDGGGIFSFLPQAAHPAHFEQLFGTPTGLDFAPVVQMYGGTFHPMTDWDQFREDITASLHQGGLRVIQVATERASNVAMHHALWQAVGTALREHLPKGILQADQVSSTVHPLTPEDAS
jgi:2-succinyl-5-enolpyruvyl-6-hydroxy-3-cyclohexene-1-carboxylate synthase